MKVLFVRPPRYMWPMNSESSSYWQPLGFLSMAAVLLKEGIKCEILDCLPLKIGWKSLEKKLKEIRPNIICVGDETASYYESINTITLVKKINPNTLVIAGGYHFSNMIKESFKECLVDIIVVGEGELTILDLLKNLNQLSKVDGIAYRYKNKIIENPERSLIKNLDSLPFPAFELLPMELYGQKSSNHSLFSSIEHGRGCYGGCDFCSIWSLMAKENKPCYRTKSAYRSYKETELLVKKYNRKTLNWADGTFNADPKWSREYFDLLKKNNIKVNHTAWVRADCIVRDERQGTLKKMVDGGLVQVVVGMERFSNKDMKILNKNNNSIKLNIKAFSILRNKYKKVFTIATMIYGMPNDRWKDLWKINKLIHSDFADIIFMLPYTPYPGTPMWERYKKNLEEPDLRKYNLHLPVLSTKYLSRKQLDFWFKFSLIDYVLLRPGNFLRRVFFEKDLRKKKVQVSLAKKIYKLGTQFIWNRLLFKKGHESSYGIKPGWYDK